MKKMFRRRAGKASIRRDSGITAIEYGLIASLIAVGILVGVTVLGNNLDHLFAYIAGRIAPPG